MQVIIVDGTNLKFSAKSDRNRWHHLGATLSSCFADHLDFVLHATGHPGRRFAVFDNPRVSYLFLETSLPSLEEINPTSAESQGLHLEGRSAGQRFFVLVCSRLRFKDMNLRVLTKIKRLSTPFGLNLSLLCLYSVSLEIRACSVRCRVVRLLLG
jgi:hypothetical protein